MNWGWILIQKECTGCGICADVCLEQAVQQTREMPYPEPVQGRCTGCMDCVKECPFAAIHVKKIIAGENIRALKKRRSDHGSKNRRPVRGIHQGISGTA